MNKKIGKVTWFNDAKGFGFIRCEDTDADIFLHYSQIMTDGFKTVSEGAKVEFDMVNSPKGATAYNVVQLEAGIQVNE